MAAREGRRVSYDRFWGGLLLVTCVLPYRLDGRSQLWRLLWEGEWSVRAWLLLGTAAGAFGVTAGLLGWRRRRRHFVNFVLGAATLALPLAAPAIWQRFPYANPGELPLGDVGSVGWVMLLSLAAVYAGSGIRIVRPSQIAGQALGGLGALLLAIFAFLPMEGEEHSFAYERLTLVSSLREAWGALAPFLLFFAACACGIVNLVRTRREVFLAKLTRLLLVAGLVVWLALPFLGRGEAAELERHVPHAWGGIRLLGPLFLALDGAVAFLAISITRSNE